MLGVAQGCPEDIMAGLKADFTGECTEVGMYLAMARVAYREGYAEIGSYFEKAAWEEAEHAAKFAELVGEVLTDSTKKNLEMRVAPARPLLPRRLRRWTLTPSTTPCTKWLATRRGTARRSRGSLTATSNKISA